MLLLRRIPVFVSVGVVGLCLPAELVDSFLLGEKQAHEVLILCADKDPQNIHQTQERIVFTFFMRVSETAFTCPGIV